MRQYDTHTHTLHIEKKKEMFSSRNERNIEKYPVVINKEAMQIQVKTKKQLNKMRLYATVDLM